LPIRAPFAGATAEPATILCIDDDRLPLSFFTDALERRRFRTLIATDGPSGIEAARVEHPDLILLDVIMPKMSGLEVCRRLRVEPGLKDTPIVLLTALHDPHLGFEGKEPARPPPCASPSASSTSSAPSSGFWGHGPATRHCEPRGTPFRTTTRTLSTHGHKYK